MHSLWELSGAISNTIKNKRPLANWQVMHQMQCSREIIEPAGISWQEEWSAVAAGAGDAEMFSNAH